MRNTDDSDGTNVLAVHPLSPEHQEQLVDESGISKEVIAERGYFTVTDPKELAKYGFAHYQRRVPCLLIPVRDVRGEVVLYLIRPDSPRVSKNKLLKYESPKDSRVTLDIPQRVQRLLTDPKVPLWITEGAKKADSAVSRGLCCIALAGVWGWRGTNEEGGTSVLPDWDSVALNDREVVIAFDSDVVEKPQVLTALTRFREMLRSRGALVRICLFPPGAEGRKTGLDDYFVRGGTVDEIVDFVDDDLPETQSVREQRGPYFTMHDGLYMNSVNSTGEPIVVKICNFVARITEEIVRDDGAERVLQFRIAATLFDQTRTALVSATEFRDLDWIHGQLGSLAVVEVGHGSSRICHAVQTMSTPTRIEVYCHTGWRRVGDAWIFLHGDGAVGPVGPVGPLAGTRVDLPEQLHSVRLPAPPTGTARVDAVKASLSLLQIAQHKVSWPLLLVAYRAVLGNAGFSLFLVGLTGTRKSSIAAVTQQHFGTGFSLTNLPGNWSSTPNAIEELLFAAKDILFVLDDFIPPAGADRSRLDLAADRVLRNVANRAGRQRMRSDGSVRPQRPSRAMVLSTGETLPRGHSLMARTFVVELAPGDVDLEQLTRVQGLGSSGALAAAMAAFLQWLSPQVELVRRLLQHALQHYRPQIGEQAMHGRTVDALAEMLFVLDLLLRFALEVGAIDTVAAEDLRQNGRKSLLELGTAQVAQQAEEDIAECFLRHLAAALSSGRAHLADAKSGSQAPPGMQEQCGWRSSDSGNSFPKPLISTWIEQGERVGWVDQDGIYLLPDVAEAVVLRLAKDRGEPINITGRSLRKRLSAGGHLAGRGRQGDDSRLLIRKTIIGTRHDLLHLCRGSLFGDRVDQPDQLDQSGATEPLELKESPPPTEKAQPPTVAPRPASIFDSGESPRTGDQPQLPSGPCRNCRSTRFWRATTGPFACDTCYPPPAGLASEQIDLEIQGAQP